tara:strand:- start:1378 stop:1755 length:378 start_codon:yes stop_codon:yes gene_type:complete
MTNVATTMPELTVSPQSDQETGIVRKMRSGFAITLLVGEVYVSPELRESVRTWEDFTPEDWKELVLGPEPIEYMLQVSEAIRKEAMKHESYQEVFRRFGSTLPLEVKQLANLDNDTLRKIKACLS